MKNHLKIAGLIAAGALVFNTTAVYANVGTQVNGTVTKTGISSTNKVPLYEGEKPTLWFGDTGKAVEYLQLLLIEKGYLKNDRVTGIYDEQTISAVRQFQNLTQTFDFGYVGKKTWTALEKSNPYKPLKIKFNRIDYGKGLTVGAEYYMPEAAFNAMNRKETTSTRFIIVENQKYYAVDSLGNDIHINYSGGLNVTTGNKSSKSETIYPTIKAEINGYDYGPAILVNNKTYLPQQALYAISSSSKVLKNTIYYQGTLYTPWDETEVPLKATPLKDEKGYNFTVIN